MKRAFSILLLVAFAGCGEETAPVPPNETPRITVMPQTLDFGIVAVGETRSLELTVANLVSAETALTVTPPAAFVDQLPAQLVLRPGERRTFELEYAPSSPDDDLDAVVIFDCIAPARCDDSVGVRGRTPPRGRLQVTTERLDFSQVAVGLERSRPVLVMNVGVAPIEIEARIDGDAGFALRDPMPTSLDAGEATTIEVVFAPTSVGTVEAQLILATEDELHSEGVSGEGVGKDHCFYAVSPESWSFGFVEATRTLRRTIQVENLSSLACHVELEATRPWSIDGVSLRSLELAPYATEHFAIEYTAVCIESCDSAIAVRINGDLAREIAITASTGSSSALLVVPNELDFGTVCAGVAARSRVVQLYNTASTAASLSNVALTTKAEGFWLEVPPLPATLEPGGSTEFRVRFEPLRAGTFDAEIIVHAEALYLVSLRGVAEDC